MLRKIGGIAVSLSLMSTLAGCATVVGTISGTFHANMFGAEEVPPGDPDGSGRAEVSISDELDQFCYKLKDVRGIQKPTAAHIHRGAKGVAGPPVVALAPPINGESHGCLKVSEAISDEIEADPASFYVNVHNEEYPSGAIRGQLDR
jgi:hypothetical protein